MKCDKCKAEGIHYTCIRLGGLEWVPKLCAECERKLLKRLNETRKRFFGIPRNSGPIRIEGVAT